MEMDASGDVSTVPAGLSESDEGTNEDLWLVTASNNFANNYVTINHFKFDDVFNNMNGLDKKNSMMN